MHFTPLFPMHLYKKNVVLRFLYLNIYSFLIICAGILTLVAPFYRINKWFFIIQMIAAIKLFTISGKLFSTWKEKVKKIDMLIKRNQDVFRPDTFDIFMQAPCGRLIVHQVLQDLHKQNEYIALVKAQKPLLERLRNNCMPVKTIVFINKDFV